MTELLRTTYARVLSGTRGAAATPFYRMECRRYRWIPWALSIRHDEDITTERGQFYRIAKAAVLFTENRKKEKKHER